MKINRKNPYHWIYLAIFTLNTCFALLLRPVLRRKNACVAILYGHKLNGNLKAIYQYAEEADSPVTLYFLTMDPAYYHSLKPTCRHVLCGLNPLHMLKVGGAFALVSDHGLHSLVLLLKYSRMKFIDVWHGIPFKGFDSETFKVQHQYDEVWVTSEKLRELYVNRFGFSREQIKITGYARTDVLLNNSSDTSATRRAIGINDDTQPVILFAPTWQQDLKNRNLYPFGINEHDFLDAMEQFCLQHNVALVLRKHLNSGQSLQSRHRNIYCASSQEFPDTEAILNASDMLICDWSSIAFDYLLLNRPTLFLDVEPPFSKGFSLDGSYRFGEIVSSMPDLLEYLARFIEEPGEYWKAHQTAHQRITLELYDDTADGRSAERCFRRLLNLRKP